MTMIEIILLLVGCVFMIGSFFISEKLSSSELNKIAELSEDELKKIIEREVNNAGTQMDEVIEQKIEEAGEQAERAMEKESNEQIMQIHEYSETVMESMKKTHDEIMFLYSMLNDKHTEMTSMTLKLYEQGLSKVEIAKQLGRGLGEVNLVIELYKGDENL